MKNNFIDILVETYKKSVNKNQNYAHNIKYSIHNYFSEINSIIRKYILIN